MSKSIWEILSPFTKPAPPAENSEDVTKEGSSEEISEESPSMENSEETPSEENAEATPSEETKEESPSEESSQETPVEENSQETSSEENSEGTSSEEPPEESSSEETSEETPTEECSEESPSEETKESTPAEPLLFRVIHKLMGCKLFVELCKFILIVLLGIAIVLTYGQVLKPEGCASFETIFAQLEANRFCNYFLEGDMEKLVANVHILTPTDSYEKDWENDFQSQITASLSHLYQEKKLGKLAQKKNITCEYQKDKVTGITHLVYTCHIQITSKEEMKLILQKDGKNKFQISTSSNGKNADTFEKMTDYFTYLSNGYYRASDYSISSLLCKKNVEDYSSLTKYFRKDANKLVKNNTYGKELTEKFTTLLSNHILLTDAVFSPYEYNKKTKELSTCLILRFENPSTNSSGILYQPLSVGLYGYAPKDVSTFYSNYMDEFTTSQICNLFATSN